MCGLLVVTKATTLNSMTRLHIASIVIGVPVGLELAELVRAFSCDSFYNSVTFYRIKLHEIANRNVMYNIKSKRLLTRVYY